MKQKIIIGYLLMQIIVMALLGWIIYDYTKSDDLQFYTFDIGQGDAIFIQTPNKVQVLIDGGPDNLVVYKLGKHLPFYDREIDLMILTHPHADHVVGLVEVLKRYKVKKILTTGVLYYSPDYLAWLDEIEKQNIAVEIIDCPRKILLDNDIILDIFFPDASLDGGKIENVNNASIAAKLIYGGTAIMLTGDYEDEESLVAGGLDLTAEVLKVGHHGSDTANDMEFLKKVDPKYAIISCGVDNKFNHPHEQTLENLEKLGIEIFRTDLRGDVHFTGNGREFQPDLKKN